MSDDAADNVKLSIKTKMGYAMPRGATVGMVLLVQALVRPYYVDELGMEVGRQAMLVAICKSVDFLIGFLVGYTSDRMTNKTIKGVTLGRRSMYIMIGFPIWIVTFYFLANPDFFRDTGDTSWGVAKEGADPAGDVCKAAYEAGEVDDCPALQECIKNLITNSSFRGWNEEQVVVNEEYAGTKLSVYFCVLYFIYYSIGFSFTIIPYDALGMELTDDYDEGAALFGYKGASQFSGYLLTGLLSMGMGVMYPESVPTQINLISFFFAILVTITFFYMFKSVKERELPPREFKPLVPAILSTFKNSPYLIYLLMKVPLSVAGMMPVAMAPYFIKLVLQEENTTIWFGAILVIIILSALAGTPLLVFLQQKYDKRIVLFYLIMAGGLFQVCAFFISSWTPLMFVLSCVPIGVITAATQIIPDALLSDIIDYDELLTGERNEGVYTIVETNLQQWIEIPAGVVPLMWLGWVGYKNNAGCSCGCGVPCPSDAWYMRWNCTEHTTGDTGYACDQSIGDPFFSETSKLLPINSDGTWDASAETRTAPCTDQNDDVRTVLKMCMFMIPGVFLIMGIIPIYLAPITRAKRLQITEMTNKRKNGDTDVVDPLTDNAVYICDTSKDPNSLMASFTRAELKILAAKGIGTIKTRLNIQMVVLAAIFFGVIALIIISPTADTVTMAALFMAFMLMLLPWQYAKIKLVKAITEEELSTILTPAAILKHLEESAPKKLSVNLQKLKQGFRPEPSGEVPQTPTA